ncbi:hypothetical protein F751_2716 [Auxenochlorella protothecoides]|uniref:Uncharacterized protein n=1 Tax=Auxenochlorella protothecoides TaxID=3075 RepID=A0A087SLY5_AUXPR|nr:hypothetical protein F751_2716 [Auxenochlorella protothecoides]KFM26739.1 hypothetical protein F751_2716 [Auxenochlorella protothecoides]
MCLVLGRKEQSKRVGDSEASQPEVGDHLLNIHAPAKRCRPPLHLNFCPNLQDASSLPLGSMLGFLTFLQCACVESVRGWHASMHQVHNQLADSQQ